MDDIEYEAEQAMLYKRQLTEVRCDLAAMTAKRDRLAAELAALKAEVGPLLRMLAIGSATTTDRTAACDLATQWQGEV